jgi:tetratricopeptide (TPR) repeat protein
MKSSTLLHKIGFYIILGLVFIFPLFFLPITSEYYEYNKYFLLLLAAGILLVIWTVSFVLDKQVRITRSPLGLPLLCLLAVWIISTISQTPNRLDAFLEPGSTGTIIALSILFFTATSFIKSKKELDYIINALVLSFSLLGFFSIIWGSSLGPKIIPWTFAKNALWTPAGNPLTVLTLLLIMVPFIGILIARQKDNSSKVLMLSIALFIYVIASGIISYQLFRQSGNKPIFLPQATSWSIAMESLKLSPLLGTGPSTYLSDFTRFKPVIYNLSPNWAIRFSTASNYYLQILTTLGLLGLISMVYLVYKVTSVLIRSVRSVSDSPTHTPALAALSSAALILISILFIPPGIITLFLLFILFILAVSSLKLMGSSLVHEANIDIVAASDTGIRTPILPWVSLILALGLVIPGAYSLAKAYYAETLFQNAIVAAGKNEGRKTYETLIAAINANPFKDTYHITASQTDLLLANSAASKSNLTADDRTLITQLIQQSIQEAKNAVTLNPNKASNVENLAAIYQNLLNFAQGADQWSIASYRQAITLDPTNPNLRIALGGIYFALKNYDQAIQLFQQAADLKPDLANAFYNISAAYKEKKDYQNAYAAMQAVITKLDRNSPDYTKAQGELEELAKLAGAAQPTATTTQEPTQLEAPQPLPTPKVNPPLSLPSELGPEPTAAPTTTPAVSPSPIP